MICIFCASERPSSIEHVFPLAIGGRIKTDRVCGLCNSKLGSRVDSALSDFLPIRVRRAELGLAGNTGKVPDLFEMLTGKAEMVGAATKGSVLTTINEETGKLDHKLVHSASNVVMPDGSKIRQISIDASDRKQIPTIIERERKRHGMRPLSDEELAIESQKYTTNTIENPVIAKHLSISFAYLEHATAKIAYELGFRWLGEAYFDDPIAAELRTAICKEDVASMAGLGWFGWATECSAFTNLWSPHRAHHLAFANSVDETNSIVIGVRIFDMLASIVTMSRNADRYLRSAADRRKLRFVAIDAATGKQVETTFQEEVHRIVTTAQASQSWPPVADPLSA